MHSQPSNSQNPSEKKRTCKDGEADLPELQNKKVHVSKAKSSGNFNGGGCRAAPPRRMSLIVWNCRELGNLCTGKELERIVQEKDPSVVFRVPGFLAGGWRKAKKKFSNTHPYSINKLSSKTNTQKSLFFNISRSTF